MKILIRILSLAFLLFLSNSTYAVHEHIETTGHHVIESDVFGNSTKLIVTTNQIRIPIVDGMMMHHERQEYSQRQEFLIDPNHNVQAASQSESLQIQKPKFNKNMQPQLQSSINAQWQERQEGFYFDVRVVSHDPGVFAAMSNDELLKHLSYNCYCFAWYHMSSAEKINMMSLRYEKFLNRLLADESLSGKAVLELWKEYKNKKKYTGREKQEKFAPISAALKKREKKQQQEALSLLQKEIERQKKMAVQELKNHEFKQLEKIYNQVPFVVPHYVSPYQQEREMALQKTKEQDYKQHQEHYELDPQTAGMLMAQGIDHKPHQRLSGTVLQHQLFKEIMNSYKKVAKACFDVGLRNSEIGYLAVAFGHAGFVATGLEIFPEALRLADLADFLAETSVSVCKGFVGSMCNFVEMYILHPRETAKQFAKMLVPMLQTIGGALNAYDTDCVTPVYNRKSSQQAFDKDLQKFNQMCVSLKHEFAKKSFQDKVQAISEFAFDGIFHPMFLSAAGKACLGVVGRVGDLGAIESFGSMVEEFGAFEEIIQGVYPEQKLATTVGEIEEFFINMMEADSNVARANVTNSIFNLSESAAFVKRLEIVNELECIMESVLSDVKRLVQEYSKFFVEFEGLGQNISMDVNHLFIPEIKFRWSYDALKNIRTCDEFGLAGWHYGCLEQFERAGFMKVVRKVIKNDCAYVECSWDYGKTLIKKTLYPECWSEEKVISSVKQAVRDPYKIISKGDSKVCLEKTLCSRLENEIKIITYLKREAINQEWCVKSSFISKDWILS